MFYKADMQTKTTELNVERAYRAILSNTMKDNVVTFWYLAPYDMRDSANKIVKAYTPVKLPAEFTLAECADILSLIGSNGGLMGIVANAEKWASKNDFSSARLAAHGFDNENVYCAYAYVKKDKPAMILRAQALISHMRLFEALMASPFAPVTLAMLDKKETDKPAIKPADKPADMTSQFKPADKPARPKRVRKPADKRPIHADKAPAIEQAPAIA